MKTKEKTHFNISQTGGDITHNRIIEANYLFLHTHNIPFISKNIHYNNNKSQIVWKEKKKSTKRKRSKFTRIIVKHHKCSVRLLQLPLIEPCCYIKNNEFTNIIENGMKGKRFWHENEGWKAMAWLLPSLKTIFNR